MQKLDNFIKNLENFDRISKNALSSAMNNHLSDFEQMQRDRLNEGLNAEGEELKRKKTRKDGSNEGYSPQYKPLRRKAGLQDTVPDLNFDGTYHAGIRAKKIGETTLSLFSIDEKHKFLDGQYNGINGFSPDQRIQVKRLLVPEISSSIKQQIMKV